MKRSRAAMRHLAEVAFIDEIQRDFFESLPDEESVDEVEAELADFQKGVTERENSQPGEALAIFRQERRLTQAQMAVMMGVSRRTYQYYEAGSQEISIGPLIRLYARYALDLNELLSGDPIEPTREDQLAIMERTLLIRKVVQRVVEIRGLAASMTDRIVHDIGKMQGLSAAMKPKMIARLANDWIEINVWSGVPTQRTDGSKNILQKKKRRKTEFRLPDLSDGHEAATYPRRRRK